MFVKKRNAALFVSALLFIVVFYFRGFGEELCKFPDLVKPRLLLVRNGCAFIPDQNSVFVYDLRDFHLIARLGQKGEGPRELKTTPFISFGNDHLFIFDPDKMIVFSKGMSFLKEIRFAFGPSQILPIGDRFVVWDTRVVDGKEYYIYKLVNEDGSEIREFIQVELPPSPSIDLISPYPRIRAGEGKIFFSRPAEDLLIEVYNKKGEKEYEIQKKLPRIKSEEKHRVREIEFFKETLSRRLYLLRNSRNEFESTPMPMYLPPLNKFSVEDGKIYIKTYDITDTKDKYIILNTHGDFEKSVFLPRVLNIRYSFYKDYFYYLRDNGEDYVFCRETVR